ncbi:MAG: glutamine--fructose-6-phosphate transaminase (isomerizing) [Caldiserica bacterium]|nr:MAG: glutamine--fructose-6-phosphate transaminase (isomerizing) [Caldisericota bacterium]
MCGIVGYIGDKLADSVLIVGLERLEYRGYDSAGVAVIEEGELIYRKKKGKIKILREILEKNPVGGNIGIGHTRWATHGEVSDENAHPHFDCNKKIAVVHNGIIENYIELKEELIKKGHIFSSTTDTEVIAHLIEENFNGDLFEATRKTVKLLKGAFAICVISEKEPDKIVVARFGSPLIVGIGKDENFVASDVPALLPHTKSFVYLKDSEMAVLYKDKVLFFDFDGNKIEKKIERASVEIYDVDKGDYPYYMLKEIYEQPEVAERILNDKLKGDEIFFENLNLSKSFLSKVKRVIIHACGTSFHAGLVGRFFLEKFARVYTEVDISSEFRYRNPLLEGDTLMIAISQSGETADTIAGLREAKSKFIKVLSIVNQEKSTIARESDGIIPIKAGPEIGVASTKAYTGEILCLYLFSLYLGRINYVVGEEEFKRYLKPLRDIPMKIRKILSDTSFIEELSDKYHKSKDFIFLGRGINYPTALEGALKLKEISYIHATGYPAGEFKHGPIALINPNMPCVCISPKSEIYDKMFSNIKEVAARKGIIISVATEGDEKIKEVSKHVIYIPDIIEELSPVLSIIPLQLLSYFIATKLGLDVDKPRNLAKSVTVE